MNYGALIVAAGMSSRMGDFKPMMTIGSISVSQRVVATFKQAGIDNIVMVTGYNADALEHHLAKNGIIFLRNENYETTSMFDSVCIGLEYMKNKVDRVLFTPVDIPLFTVDTVKKLMESDGEIVRPKCGKKYGHPIAMSAKVLNRITSYTGENGLKGAIDRFENIVDIKIKDEGTIHDADTKEDFSKLLEYHNNQLVHPIVDICFAKEKVFFNSDIYLLLSLVDETGSVLEACEKMHISYSSGWNIINKLESQLSTPIILRKQGGCKNMRSCLTEYGKEFLANYSSLQAEVRKVSDELFLSFFPEFK